MRKEEVLPNVFNMIFSRQRDMAETFVRFSEHYESPEFRGKVFTLEEFQQWYTANSPRGKRTGRFTYYQDWTGFNIPSYVLGPFYGGAFDPLSDREKRLLDAFEEKRGTDFYLLGTRDGRNMATLKHEIGHALYYVSPEYRAEVMRALEEMDPGERMSIARFLLRIGYDQAVVTDETHACLLDRRFLGSHGITGKGIETAGRKIKRAFRKHYQRLRLDG